MSYKANMHEFDRDYHSSYGRDITIDVDSWKEATDWCKENSKRPYYYTVNYLRCKKTNKVYYTEKDMTKEKTNACS